MFLLGGGFAISKGSNASCLSNRIGESLVPLKELSPFGILCVTCLFTGTITEFTSNIGIANIMLPVIAQMVRISLHALRYNTMHTSFSNSPFISIYTLRKNNLYIRFLYHDYHQLFLFLIQSVAIEINPLYVMIPSALICSYAFRLPVGTPPNAIVTVTGKLPVKHLMIGGCMPAIYSFFVVIALFPIWGTYVYDIKLDEFPDWAKIQEQTYSHCLIP